MSIATEAPVHSLLNSVGAYNTNPKNDNNNNNNDNDNDDDDDDNNNNNGSPGLLPGPMREYTQARGHLTNVCTRESTTQ